MIGKRSPTQGHPLGAQPFGRDDYVGKFRQLTENILPEEENDRFLALAYEMPRLELKGVNQLGIMLPLDRITASPPCSDGIF